MTIGLSPTTSQLLSTTLKDFDYVDIGEPIEPAGVLPVVIKSLLFSAGGS